MATTSKTALLILPFAAACTGNLPAPDNFGAGPTDETTGESDDGNAPEDRGPLSLACGTIPAGAVDAVYAWTPDLQGGLGEVVVTATGLPPGTSVNQTTGEVSGTPTSEGSFTISLSASDERDDSQIVNCDVTVNPRIGLEIDADGTRATRCLNIDEDARTFVVSGTGDESDVSCSVATGSGDGRLPTGLSLDSSTCTFTGTVDASLYGSFAWMVRLDQNGASTYVPYCATQETPPASAYSVLVEHSNEPGVDKRFVPPTGTFTVGQKADFGGSGDPQFTVTDASSCGMNRCFYGFSWSVNASPFKANCEGSEMRGVDCITLTPDSQHFDMGGAPDGFTHELHAVGDDVDSRWEGRPFIANFSIDYCINAADGPCQGRDMVRANGTTRFEYPVIMWPAN